MRAEQDRDLRGEFPGSSQEPALTIGLSASPGPASELTESLVPEIAERLAEQLPGVRWRVGFVSDRLVEPPTDLSALISAGRRMFLDRGWELAVCVTDLPLQTARRPVIAHVSATHGVAVLSMPALGPVAVRKHAVEAIVRLVGATLGDVALAHDGSGRDLPVAEGVTRCMLELGAARPRPRSRRTRCAARGTQRRHPDTSGLHRPVVRHGLARLTRAGPAHRGHLPRPSREVDLSDDRRDETKGLQGHRRRPLLPRRGQGAQQSVAREDQEHAHNVDPPSSEVRPYRPQRRRACRPPAGAAGSPVTGHERGTGGQGAQGRERPDHRLRSRWSR